MWIEPADLERLTALRTQAAAGPVLSLYLPLDRTPAVDRGYVALAKDLLKAGIPETSAASDAESARVIDYLQTDFTPGGKTLVLFSRAGEKTPVALHLQLSLPGVARYGDSPYLAPLDLAEENYPPIAVVALDERAAIIFTTVLGEIDSRSAVRDDVPGRQRQGGWAAFKIEDDRAEHVRDHFRHVATVLGEMAERTHFRRIVVGSSPETFSGFHDALPGNLRDIVAGRFSAELFAPEHELVSLAMAVAAEAERKEEVELVTEVRERALAGGKASLGWDETLQCLTEGRVHRLALAEHHLGSALGDRALELAWQTGAGVEFVGGTAAELLTEEGGIGALLRF